MGIRRWSPGQELSEQEEGYVERMEHNGKLFAFLRRHRHELFDEGFQQELEGMYRQTGAGKAPVAPGLMAMATLLQGYLGASDATMVELTVFDLRVQMVLGWLGHSEAAFSQGALSDFRQRLMRTQMDRRLLERTVEDTLNLLGHAARKVAQAAARVLGWSLERVCREAAIPLLLESSIKKGLDLDWN